MPIALYETSSCTVSGYATLYVLEVRNISTLTKCLQPHGSLGCLDSNFFFKKVRFFPISNNINSLQNVKPLQNVSLSGTRVGEIKH